jgi:hypothetical protein
VELSGLVRRVVGEGVVERVNLRMLTERILMLIGTLFLTWGIGWACSMLTRKATLAELLTFIAYWAIGAASVRWISSLLRP